MKIFIPLICYNHMCFTEYMVSILKLVSFAKDEGIDCSFYPIFFDPSIGRARNAAIAKFLQDKDNTHLLFIDSDTVFEPEDVLKLIQSDKDVIGGSYPKKYIVWDRLKEDINAEKVDFTTGGNISVTEDNFLSVDYIPTGFLLIKRKVISDIINKHPNIKYTNQVDGYGIGEEHYDLYTVGINEKGTFNSGNWRFCSLWTEMGGKLLVHPEVNVGHIGWYEYRGNLMNHLINLKK